MHDEYRVQHRGLIVTFHAFKGGTGRTLALANVARVLADEMGYRVGLVDLDVDSPGLVHEPLCEALEPMSTHTRTALLEAIDDQEGFLESFIELASVHSANPTLDLTKVDIELSARVLSSDDGGTLLLIPTARGSVTKTDTYSSTVRTFNRILGEIVSGGSSEEDESETDVATTITWHILRTFIEHYQLDYLFIDGRTGAGPFSPVYIYSIPHLLVLFLGLNDQNVLGSLSILRKQTADPGRPVPVLLVASPVPTVGPQDLEQRLAFVTRQLRNDREKRATEARDGRLFAYALPSAIDHLLPYSDAAAFGEIYFPGMYPNSLLARAYRKLANEIESLVVSSAEGESSGADARRGLLITTREGWERRPITVAIENVHHDLLKEAWPASRVEFKPYPADAASAPWERLRNCNDARSLAQMRDELPDVLVIPQSRIEAINAISSEIPGRHTPLLWDLTELRHSDHSNGARAMHFDFLDSYYGNWRSRCSVRQHVMGLPFSVNATLLCANEKLLTPVCSSYWRRRSQEPPNPFFLPSSWAGLLGLLEAAQFTANPRCVYSIVLKEQGLYYEWLNCVTALGGFDLIQGEGGLIEDVRIDSPETIEATELFVELFSLCGTSERMDEQISKFAARELALYMGWTDSFRFGRTADGTLSSVYPTSLQSSEWERSDKYAANAIRLGRCPRDMRQSRACLVDGWLMTFPRKDLSRSEPIAGLQFADAFLDPQRQRELLLRGFPSASRWVVEQEIETLNAHRSPRAAVPTEAQRMSNRVESSFEVFLETLRAAMSYGRWVASLDNEISDLTIDTLQKLIQANSRWEIAKTLRDLGETVRAKLKLI